MAQRDLIKAVLNSNMATEDKHELIAELIRLDFLRDPKKTKKLIREYLEANPYPKARQ